MRPFLWITVISTVLIASCSHQKKKVAEVTMAQEKAPELTKVAEFYGAQVTGVTVSRDGRIFANFPRWRDNVPFSVVEIGNNGTTAPYPNEEWNRWYGSPRNNHFTCVQSVLAHGNSLFVLDPSSPKMEKVVGHATLYEFDLDSNKLKRKWTFNSQVAPKKSYLNDLRVDDEDQKIFITDSGLGALVVLDLRTGNATRVLEDDASTKAEKITLTVDKRPFLMKGSSPRIHSDGIAYNPSEKMVYYHALTAKHLYRVPASNPRANQVENLGETPAPDGMVFDRKGNLYMADLEKNAIVYRTPDGEIKTLVQDERIKWADTFAIDGDNNLLFTDSRINEALPGSPVDQTTFTIYKVPLNI